RSDARPSPPPRASRRTRGARRTQGRGAAPTSALCGLLWGEAVDGSYPRADAERKDATAAITFLHAFSRTREPRFVARGPPLTRARAKIAPSPGKPRRSLDS